MSGVAWGKRDDMIVHEVTPFNAESPAAALTDDVTATEAFYARNHGPIPDIASDTWRVTIDGSVERKLTLSIDDLASGFAEHSVVATLQCAGNRRAGFNKIAPIDGEDPWGSGAISTAVWHGARLGDVLEAAGVVARSGLHVAFEAPDVTTLATPAQVYGSSIPVEKALSPEVLLAWKMNGEPLPRLHGGPVRVVVPGYIGARSVKWVTSIGVRESPSPNYFQAVAYRILPADVDPDATDAGEGISLSSVALTSEILTPSDAQRILAGPLTIRGYALAGDRRGVARVDVSLDHGITWLQADLAAQRGPWAWRLWSLSAEVAPGPLSIMARAWDDTAALQPESAAALWNPKGYVNNSWPRITVNVCD